MKKFDFAGQPNLAVRDFTIPAGGEWLPLMNGWSLVQVRQGAGYYLQPDSNLELETGAVIAVAGCFQGSIRASQLGELSLFVFNIIPERLTAFMTLGEQQIVKTPPGSESRLKFLPTTTPLAIKTAGLLADNPGGGFLFRLQLIQIFAELFLDGSPPPESPALTAGSSDAINRLQLFLKQISSSELLEMDFNDLAKRTHCTSRHLSRIFYKLVGMSFSDKRSELRLEKARHLLATSDTKVVQVALESGYNSLSQFNLMFARRYGISPGKWRHKHGLGNIKHTGKNGGLRFNSSANLPSVLNRRVTLKLAGKRATVAALTAAGQSISV